MSTPEFVELHPDDVAAVAGGAFDFGSLAQSLMQNVSGQLGAGGSPIAGILGQVMGMIGKGGATGASGAGGAQGG